MTRLYRRFAGRDENFDDVLYACKKRIMQVNLASEMNVLARDFHRLSMSDWRTRDFTFNGMLSALEEVIAAFPVYRTYVDPQGASADDRRYIEWAIALAKNALAVQDTTHLRFHAGCADRPSCRGIREPDDVLRAAMQFQQVTGPVMAKAAEDTAFYRYFRLLPLNEVGGDPRRFGMSVAAFHHLTQERARSWPRAMVTTATHDTKRGEDGAAAPGAVVRDAARMGPARHAVAAPQPLATAPRSTAKSCPTAMSNTCSIRSLLGAWPPGLDPGDTAGMQASRRAHRGLHDQGGARGKAAVELEQPERRLRGCAAALCARRARCARGTTRSSPISRLCRIAGAAGGDRFAWRSWS